MRGRSYDSKREFQQRNKQQSSSTHFLGLECVLDKYQHQNTMLSQQIKLLLNENRMLRQNPGNKNLDEFAPSYSKGKKEVDHNERQRSKTLCYRYKQNAQNRQSGQNRSRQQCLSSRRQNKVYRQVFKTENASTDRKYRYLKQTTSHNQNGINKKKQDSYSRKSNYSKPYHYQCEFSNVSQDVSTKITDQGHSKTRSPIFNRQVYLDQETFLVSQEDAEKLPTFVEPSFGNIDLAVENNPYVDLCPETLGSKYQNIKETKKMKEPNFKLGRSQVDSKQVQIPNNIVEQVERMLMSDKEKENIEVVSGRKTNYPYIKNQFKIAEPKTQLTSIFYPQRNKQYTETGVTPLPSTRDKRRFLNVISRGPKKSLFTK